MKAGNEMAQLSYSNINKEQMKLLEKGLYIARSQSAVSHESFPDHWQYFGPYEEPVSVEKYHRYGRDDNEKHYNNGEIKEIIVKDWTYADWGVKIKGQLIKTWEEFYEEDDCIHHSYCEEYQILEVLDDISTIKELNETLSEFLNSYKF